jgi:hypothetical protein
MLRTHVTTRSHEIHSTLNSQSQRVNQWAQEAEISRIVVRGPPGQKVNEIPISTNSWAQ